MGKIILLQITFILALYSCNFPNKKTESKQSEFVNKRLEQLVEENNIPGLNFSIIYSDGKQENYSSGFSDVEQKVPLNTNHVLFSGSIGKTYAAAVLMQLVDEGEVDLKKKIISYFPEVEWMELLPNIQEITVEMLLQHTTGLTRYAMKPAVWDTLKADPDKVWTYKERLSMVFNDEPLHEAGKGWAYSDTNYILIGMLIEKITGNDYYEEVKLRILKPEGLNSTHPSIKRDLPNLPVSYSKLPEEFHMPEIVVNDGKYIINPQMEWTGGGMASTTSDVAKWAKIYYEGKLFSDSLLAKIITPNKNATDLGGGVAYGMGSFIFDSKPGKAYGHTGFVPGFNSIFAYFPESEVAVALQVNCDYAANKIPLIRYIERILEVLDTK